MFENNSDFDTCKLYRVDNLLQQFPDSHKRYNFKCTVYHLFYRCNGIQDCPRNDDEYHCAFCLEDEFTCDNQKCILKSWVCDTVDDCDDNSDEADCSSSKKNIKDLDCKEFKCTNNTCLPFNRVCDGIKDCSDGSDEHINCCM